MRAQQALGMGDGAAARISVAEMKSYFCFCEWCFWLLSTAEGKRAGMGERAAEGERAAKGHSRG